MRKIPEPKYDMPNMAAVADETRPYTDPRAGYDLAQKARTARAKGATRRRS